jgi:hypothetical protein
MPFFSWWVTLILNLLNNKKFTNQISSLNSLSKFFMQVSSHKVTLSFELLYFKNISKEMNNTQNL